MRSLIQTARQRSRGATMACWLVSALSVALGMLAVAAGPSCGGSTGREGLPLAKPQLARDASAADATIDVGTDSMAIVFGDAHNEATLDAKSPDATMSADGGSDSSDNGSFVVVIAYADANRLDAVATVPGHGDDAGDAAVPLWRRWPDCPPDLIDTSSGFNVPPSSGACAPPIRLDAGDGGYVWSDSGAIWMTREECDQCMRVNYPAEAFPPCSDLRDAGTVPSGPAAGQKQFDLCATVYTCILQSGCGTALTAHCYCGTADVNSTCQTGGANGPCMNEIENAMQLSHTDPKTPTTVTAGFNNVTDMPYKVATQASNLFTEAQGACSLPCFASRDGGP